MPGVASAQNLPSVIRCVRCGAEAPELEWSELSEAGHVLNLWCCTACGCMFETAAEIPAGVLAKKDKEAMDDFFPTLLVA